MVKTEQVRLIKRLLFGIRHAFALETIVASHAFYKNENKIWHYLVYLKPSGDNLLISRAIKFAFPPLFVTFSFGISLFFISQWIFFILDQ